MKISENSLMHIFFQVFVLFAMLFVSNIQLAFVIVFIDFFFLFSSYIRKGFCDHAAYIAFLFSLFTFLMGGFLLNLGNEEYFRVYSDEGYLHIAKCLLYCLAFSSISYNLFCTDNYTDTVIFEKKDKSNVLRIRKAAMVIFYIFSIFSVIVNGEKVLFVRNNTYLQYYTDYASILPSMFANLASVSEFAYYVFMATIPSKKQCAKPTILFLLINAMSLGYGQRNGFVVSFLFVVIYYAIRHKLDGETWLTKRVVIIALLATPFLIAALYAFNYVRSDQEVKVNGVGNQIVAFFDEQSVSSQIIGYGYEYKDSIKENGVNYSLSQLTNIITKNAVVKKMFGTGGYTGQTVENALYGTNFGHAITYKVMPTNYLRGIGMGTSYVAEAYHDFGYFGVALINVLYGALLSLFQKKRFANLANKAHPYTIAILLMELSNIIYAPRNITFGFVSQTLTLTTLIAILAIYLLSGIIKTDEKQ